MKPLNREQLKRYNSVIDKCPIPLTQIERNYFLDHFAYLENSDLSNLDKAICALKFFNEFREKHERERKNAH